MKLLARNEPRGDFAGKFGLTAWKTLEDMEWMAEFLKRYVPVDIRDVCYHDSAKEIRNRLEKTGFKNAFVLNFMLDECGKDTKKPKSTSLNL